MHDSLQDLCGLALFVDDSASEAAAPAPDAKSPNGDEYLTVSFDDAAETDPGMSGSGSRPTRP